MSDINPPNPPAPPRRAVHDVLSDEQKDAALAEVLAKLRSLDLPLRSLTLRELNKDYLTYAIFMKMQKVVSAMPSPAVARKVYAEAIKQDVVADSGHLDLPNFAKFCEWLRSRKGQEAQTIAARAVKMAKKMPAEADLAAVGLAHAFRYWAADYAATVKRARAEFDKKIDRYRQLIRETEAETEKELKSLAEQYFPASQYREPSSGELADASYAMYAEAAREAGKDPMPRDHPGLLKVAVEKYGDKVKRNRMLEFCQNEEYKPHIRKYVESKLAECESARDRRQATTFRAMLDLIGGGSTPPGDSSPAPGGLRARKRKA